MLKISILLSSIFSLAASFAQKNNALLILVDDLGVDPMAGYMPEALQKASTPVIDSLRESGIAF